MAKYKIDINKQYIIPPVSVVRHNGEILVISPKTANWIVLPSEVCLEIFESLKMKKSIQEILSLYPNYINEVKTVITQLEARHFCNKKFKSVTEDFKQLHFYITNNCNLCCPHCYRYSGKAKEKELNTTQIIN
ncbi:MAG: hypothetical protein HDR88_12610 [Bacteroides sp.]|nr:hypothetical protein [Bacteroides sp.]